MTMDPKGDWSQTTVTSKFTFLFFKRTVLHLTPLTTFPPYRQYPVIKSPMDFIFSSLLAVWAPLLPVSWMPSHRTSFLGYSCLFCGFSFYFYIVIFHIYLQPTSLFSTSDPHLADVPWLLMPPGLCLLSGIFDFPLLLPSWHQCSLSWPLESGLGTRPEYPVPALITQYGRCVFTRAELCLTRYCHHWHMQVLLKYICNIVHIIFCIYFIFIYNIYYLKFFKNNFSITIYPPSTLFHLHS